MTRVVLWAWSLTALFSGTAHADCVASYFSQPKVQHMTVDEARRSMIKDAAYVRCLTHTSARARPSKIGVADLPVKSAVPISTKVAKVDDLPPEYVVQMYGML